MINDFLIAIGIFSIFILVIVLIAKRYKHCPADKILVVFGAVGNGKHLKCIYGGATFVKPIIQGYEYLDLKTFESEISETIFDKHNFPITIQVEVCFGINTSPDFIEIAAERLLGRPKEEIKSLGLSIIQGQIRVVFGTYDLIEILTDREKLVTTIYDSIENEINKIGLKLIRFNLKNISDKYNVSNALTKEIDKAINRRQIDSVINIEEYKMKLVNLNERLENIEKERLTLLSEKIELCSQLILSKKSS